MGIKTIRYRELYRSLIELYQKDNRIMELETIEELINFFAENDKNLLYYMEEENARD